MTATVRTKRKANRFLAALSEGASVTAACKAAAISKNTVYAWKSDDSTFHAAWELALDTATEKLEDHARDIAVTDRDGPMTRFLLQAQKPEKYASKEYHRHSLAGGNVGGRLDLTALTANETAEVERLMAEIERIVFGANARQPALIAPLALAGPDES